MHLFAHSPFSADPNRYYPHRDWRDKTIDVLDVDGVLSQHVESAKITPAQYRSAKICVLSRYVNHRL